MPQTRAALANRLCRLCWLRGCGCALPLEVLLLMAAMPRARETKENRPKGTAQAKDGAMYGRASHIREANTGGRAVLQVPKDFWGKASLRTDFV